VAFVVVHESVDDPPCVTALGVAVSVSVGAGAGGETATTMLPEPDPPRPLQVSVKVVVCVSAGVANVPEVALAPAQPPEAVQVCALVDDQVRFDVPPCAT
jgi:hypothetical protein